MTISVPSLLLHFLSPLSSLMYTCLQSRESKGEDDGTRKSLTPPKDKNNKQERKRVSSNIT